MNVNWIITAFVIVDTTFTTLEHQSDVRAGVPDSEIITVALVAAKYFANNHKLTLSVMQQLHYLSGTISHSRFNRRLHALRDWMEFFPEYLGEILSKNTIYIIDSMPMPVCHRARAKRCTKVRGKYFSGWCAAKQERYFGWKLHLIYDIHGIPIHFMMLPARPHDITAVNGLASTMPFGSIILGDPGYICEKTKHQLDANCGVQLIARQRANMIPNTPAELQLLRMHRRRIETFNSQLEKMGITRLHARNTDGVMIKLCASLSALSLTNYR